MSDSYLIQRLDRPFKKEGLLGEDNTLAFGGGLKNGGLSDEAMGLLRDIFSFDYMGSAEFEFGAVPEALQKIAAQAEAGDLVARTFSIPTIKAAKPWRGEETPPAKDAKSTIYVLCLNEWLDEVIKRIKVFAAETVRTKESVGLARVLRPGMDSYVPRTGGWLEIDNGFMFFTDIEMWTKTASLFGVEIVPDD